VLLQAVAPVHGGAVPRAFDDAALKRLLRVPGEEHPLVALPV